MRSQHEEECRHLEEELNIQKDRVCIVYLYDFQELAHLFFGVFVTGGEAEGFVAVANESND